MIPLSIIILTRNEEAAIERCLRSALWADEVLVIDGGSTDGTRSIAERFAPKVRWLERAWTGFRDQRNYGLDSAKNDWVFFLDADEAISDELRNRLQGLLGTAGGPPCKYYKVRRQEYFLGKPVFHGIWNPSYQDRFFFKSGVRFVNEVHEYPAYPSAPQSLHEPIHHWPDFSIEKFLSKMNHYTSIEAKDRYRSGQRTNGFKLLFAFPAMFYKNYFYYGAYKDGFHGFVISLLEGVSRVVRHMKMWQLGLQEKSR
jgi:glycosyltransferase involved in cell wall biosynthesis